MNRGFTKGLVGNDEFPPYAILSHTWQDDQEAMFEDWKNGRLRSEKAGYDRIVFVHSGPSAMGWTAFG